MNQAVALDKQKLPTDKIVIVYNVGLCKTLHTTIEIIHYDMMVLKHNV